jgi:hypothetical protein
VDYHSRRGDQHKDGHKLVWGRQTRHSDCNTKRHADNNVELQGDPRLWVIVHFVVGLMRSVEHIAQQRRYSVLIVHVWDILLKCVDSQPRHNQWYFLIRTRDATPSIIIAREEDEGRLYNRMTVFYRCMSIIGQYLGYWIRELAPVVYQNH